MTVNLWSQTAATNATVDASINWRENQAPSTVNNSARAMMAAIAKWRDDVAGNILTGGSSTAYTITSNQSLTPIADGYTITARMHATNGAAPTLNVDATGAKAIRVYTSTALPEAAINAGSVHRFTYDSGDDCWYITDFFTTTTLALVGLLINGATELTAPAIADEMGVYDASATANRKLTLANLFKVINGLTAETSPATDDELVLYDLSATTADKITLANLLTVVNALTEDTSPDESADFLLSYDTSASAVKKVKPYSLIVPGAIVCIAEDNQTSGTDGGSIASGADRTRTLNTLVYNRGSMASLATNQLTLPAGTWEICWEAPVASVPDNGEHQSLLYNVTDAAEVKRGTSGSANAASGQDVNSSSWGSTVVTIAGSKAFEIRHRFAGSGALTQGHAASFGTEVYTRVIVRAA